jgi:hypothetical protein
MRPLRRHRSDSTQLRSSLADAAWAVEDRVVWGTADLVRGAAGTVGGPFERIAAVFQEWVVLPFEDLTAGWSDWLRRLSLALVGVLAIGAVAAGIALSNSGGGNGSAEVAKTFNGQPASVPVRVSKIAAAPDGPVLHGVQPRFTPTASASAASAASLKGATAASGDAATVLKSEPSSSSAAKDGEKVAGPAAMDVAHRFAEAFVLYEIGKTDAKVRSDIAATASPVLTQALLKRPPRLPANVKVPEAKVLNIVPGPKQGDSYTLSISLLRLGATSELRIDMQRDKSGRWQVTDTLG